MKPAMQSFEWDEAKGDECLANRGFDFAYATRLFDGEVFVRLDDRNAYGEVRQQAIGYIDGLLFVVIYTLRAGVCRFISARRAHLEEWSKWQKSR